MSITATDHELAHDRAAPVLPGLAERGLVPDAPKARTTGWAGTCSPAG